MNISEFLSNKKYRFDLLSKHGFYNNMSDKKYISLAYEINMGAKLDLECPKLYNEKLQWLKLHDRNPLYTKMVDKYEMKNYVKSILGDGYTVPTLGVWDSFDDIDFGALPNQFVLKCTHDSGGLVICKDKTKLDIEQSKKKISDSLSSNYYLRGREWPYKNVKRRVIAEEYMKEDASGWLTDYKFFCFNGEPKIVYISKDRSENPHTDFFDMEFNHLDMRMKDPNSSNEQLPQKPARFNDMIEIAKALSKEIPHVRVDFYMVDDKIYVGEMTFYHCGGFALITPEEWAKKMGDWIDLHLAWSCRN